MRYLPNLRRLKKAKKNKPYGVLRKDRYRSNLRIRRSAKGWVFVYDYSFRMTLTEYSRKNLSLALFGEER